ncbi:MAG: Ig-like domain-containing protein [Bacteroidales bacterium]|nr:Ig-like domain-containing protein [Bacteroidales bacterium]
MKRRFLIFALAALTVGLLGSCSKINERIDGLDKRTYDIENKQIASIDQQVAAIKASIADLEAIRADVKTAMDAKTAQGEDITALQTADQVLEGKINDLRTYVDTELAKYASTEWANATFATLEKQAEILADIAALKTGLEGVDSKIDEAIAGLDSSLKGWVNGQLSAYYKKAEMDAKVKALQDELDALKAGGETDKSKIEGLETKLTELTEDLEAAKATIKTEYEAAITAAINENNGTINQTIQSKIDEVNATITALTGRVEALETTIGVLSGRIDAIEAMIQTVTIVPAYDDGSVEATDGVLCLDIIVEPAAAVATLTKDSLKVLVNDVMTKAVSLDTVAVTAFNSDAANGTITARADISSVLPEASGKALAIAVNVSNGLSKYTTKFYPVTLSSSVTITDGPTATNVTIKGDEDFPGSVEGKIPVADGFKESKPTIIKVGGIGTVTFDEYATSKIKANAEQAGATSVSFKVEDVTTTKPVPNADVVLEVTMKTVDETGTEVYCEQNAAGEVTIEIPMDEDVVFVNSVTLVNDAGEPIEGGVVPGSEEIENGILTFKVNHFSKYAVDYVTKAEFVSVTGVSVEPASVTLQVGDTLRLAAIITPDNATNKKVTWSSSDTTKVKVDDTGKITAVAFGEATITVTTKDGGKTATCTVKVSETKTMAEILKTISGIPEVDDTTPPSNAWVNSTNPDCKAFVGKVDGDKCFILKAGAENFGVLMDDTFEKVDDNTFRRVESGIGTLTVKMEEGKFSSLEFQAESGSKFEVFNGTYAPESFIDLGVTDAAGKPVYWAKCNVGAISPQDYGDCFAWGETAPYYEGTGGWPSTPTWKTGKTAGYDWLSYCGSSEFVEWSTPPYDATTKILKPAFDAATTVNSGWRTPTSAELVALASSCVCIWTTDYNGTGVAGYLVYKAKDEADKGLIYSENHAWHIWNGSGYTAGPDAVETYSPSDVHIFLPAAGCGYGTDHSTDTTVYMSSTLCTEYEEGHAYTLYLSKFDMGPRNTFDFPARFIGCFIRPVKN